MNDNSEENAPDRELRELVARFIDQSLTEAQRDRLEMRLREDPAAKEYCADAVRFEATMQEAMNPQSLEWEEVRRVIFDMKKGKPAWSVQRNQTLRYGDSHRSLISRAAARKRSWWLGGIGLLAVTAAAGLLHYQSRANTYSLRNGDFEAMDLGRSPRGVDRSVLYWQDYFSTDGTELCEVGRVSGGKFHAKSGRNAVRLRDRAFLNQIILNRAGSGLKAEPGLKVVVRGWSYAQDLPPYTLRASLRFVASGYPDMIQSEAANVSVSIKDGGWHRFETELVLPEDLLRTPSDLSRNTGESPPAIHLEGKELTLSLDNHSPGGVIFLDDLEIEVRKPGK
jgi:hypothetical protein